MRGLVQRVSRASVTVRAPGADPEVVGVIGPGLCVLVGVTHDDTPEEARRLARKVWELRILPDAEGVMNRSAADRAAEGEECAVLVVSQFTLLADTRKGNRPSFTAAADPAVAAPLVEAYRDRLAALGLETASGRFGAHMDVALVNDGPVTIVLDVTP
ncbi:MAG: D-aminoacyl-tRNA deacylase [Actinomycetota bacterium]